MCMHCNPAVVKILQTDTNYYLVFIRLYISVGPDDVHNFMGFFSNPTGKFLISHG